MAFIRVQKLVRDSNGNILSGSAAIKERSTSRMEVSSIPGRLCANVSGKPSAWLRTANPEYSFPPPSRGLVSYNSVSDSFDEVGRDDERLSNGSVDVFSWHRNPHHI